MPRVSCYACMGTGTSGARSPSWCTVCGGTGTLYAPEPGVAGGGGHRGGGGKGNKNPLVLLVVIFAGAWLLMGPPQWWRDLQSGSLQPSSPPTRDAEPPAALPEELRAPAPASPSSDALQTIRGAWRTFPDSKDACGTDHDYFPGGGLRTQLCHLWSIVRYESIPVLVGVPIFTRGPHSTLGPVLDDPNSFGYYNPAFVRWLVDHGIEAGADSEVRALTQRIYDRHLRTLVRIFHVTYRKTQSEPDCFASEVGRYVEKLQSDQGLPPGYYNRFHSFMHPDFCRSREDAIIAGEDGGVDGNLVGPAVAFWVRRTIDGTAGEFARGVARLLTLYDSNTLTL